MTTNFFDNAIIQDFFVREKRQVVLPPFDATKVPSQMPAAVTAFQADIAQLGFTLDGHALANLSAMDNQTLAQVHDRLVQVLQRAVGAHVKYRALFRRFPDDVPDDTAYLLRRIWGYLENLVGEVREGYTVLSCGHVINREVFDVSEFGACPICQRGAPELAADKLDALPLAELTPLKVLTLAGRSDVLRAFTNAAQARSSLSESTKGFVRAIVAEDFTGAFDALPAEMPFKENMALALSALVKAGVTQAQVGAYFKTSTDVLRVAVGLSDGDLSLAEACKFKLSNPYRRFILQALEALDQSQEQMLADMVGYLGRWLRLGEVLHVRQVAAKYPKTAGCFEVLRNRPHTVATFEAQVGYLFDQASLSRSQWNDLLGLLSQRPGEFARKLDALLLRGGAEAKALLDRFAQVASQLPTPMLLTMMGHFRTRGEKAQLRAFLPKGSAAKMFVMDGDKRDTLPLEVRCTILDNVRSALLSRFAQAAPLGKVYIDETLDKVLVPLAQRNASAGLVPVPRGSRIPCDMTKGFLRLFVHWMETADTGRVDLDLSAGLYNADWTLESHLSWTNLRSYGRSVHSGDMQSAPPPHGAAEFVDLDLEAIRRSGARYALISVYSYTGQHFKSMPAFAGVMAREEPGRGQHFEASTVTQKFDITSDTTAVAPLAVDLETGEMLWMDMALKGGRYGTLEGKSERMTQMARAIDAMQHSRPSLYDLFELHAAARGQQVHTAEEADLVLDAGQVLKLDEILAHWL